MAGRSTLAAFVRATDPRKGTDTGRMVKPRTAGTTPPGDRGRSVT